MGDVAINSDIFNNQLDAYSNDKKEKLLNLFDDLKHYDLKPPNTKTSSFDKFKLQKKTLTQLAVLSLADTEGISVEDYPADMLMPELVSFFTDLDTQFPPPKNPDTFTSYTVLKAIGSSFGQIMKARKEGQESVGDPQFVQKDYDTHVQQKAHTEANRIITSLMGNPNPQKTVQMSDVLLRHLNKMFFEGRSARMQESKQDLDSVPEYLEDFGLSVTYDGLSAEGRTSIQSEDKFPGVYRIGQDALYADEENGIVAIFDGVSSQEGKRETSLLAAAAVFGEKDRIINQIEQDKQVDTKLLDNLILKRVFRPNNEPAYEHSGVNQSTALLVVPIRKEQDGSVVFRMYSLGDSFAKVLHADGTVDQTHIDENAFERDAAGEKTHVIRKFLGMKAELDISDLYIKNIRVFPGQRLLIASDGMEQVPDDQYSRPISDLVREQAKNGKQDDTTVAIISVP